MSKKKNKVHMSFNPLMPTKYSMAERQRLRDFEKRVLYGIKDDILSSSENEKTPKTLSLKRK